MNDAKNSRTKVRLFRGIAVSLEEVEEVVKSIKDSGLVFTEKSSWRNNMADPRIVRTRSEEFLQEPASIREKILSLPLEPVIYACGDLYGATYYGLSHNRSETKPASIVIEFEAPLESLCVDGKDFLYTVFQMWDARSAVPIESVRSVLASSYGAEILPYFDDAASRINQQERIGICELACHDIEVVRAHAANKILICGRYHTRFCSAFKLQLPVLASAIRMVESQPYCPEIPASTITLNDLL